VGVAAVALLGLGATWINTIQSQLGGLDRDDVIPGIVAGSTLSAEHRIRIESAETKDGKTSVYFKVTNETSDILTFSDKESIKLETDEGDYGPEAIQDRQNTEFVKKILSGSTVYGVLVFPEIKGGAAKITFDQLYFEQAKGSVFREVEEINLNELKPIEELRS
jgi:hypothetical protein